MLDWDLTYFVDWRSIRPRDCFTVRPRLLQRLVLDAGVHHALLRRRFHLASMLLTPDRLPQDAQHPWRLCYLLPGEYPKMNY